MARKILDRKALRQQVEAAQESQGDSTPKTPAKPRRSRPKAKKETKLIAMWGVFSQTLVEVQAFDYSRRDEAEKLAQELTQSKRAPHFVQLVKRQVEVEISAEE